MIDRIRIGAYIVFILLCVFGIMYADYARGCETSGQSGESQSSASGDANSGGDAQSGNSDGLGNGDGLGIITHTRDIPVMCEYDWPWLIWCPVVDE